MRTHDIPELTERMVADCRLETASVFFVDAAGADPHVSYLYHSNVSSEAQHSYAARGVFRGDPFVRAADRGAGGRAFIRWGDDELRLGASAHSDYRAFIDHHDIAVVGALSRRITPTLHLVIGAHRVRGTRWRDEVPMAELTHRITHLSDLVVEHLFDDLLGSSAGRVALQIVLPPVSPVGGTSLSGREVEIAALICAGKQNKHVAHALGISLFTVENHLRRMYRKLGIHTRAALVAHFSGRLH